jgi:hypothetical protein
MSVAMSASPLWSWLRSRYADSGLGIWQGGRALPQWITTNRVIARTYARLIAAWHDGKASQPSASPIGARKAETPLNIVELGAGSGRLALNIVEELPLHGVERFTYVATDLSAARLEFFAKHPQLRAAIDAGRLAFALTDAELGTLKQKPSVLIANYVFDSLPHDLFQIDRGAARTVLVDFAGSDTAELSVEYRLGEVVDKPYTTPLYNDILDEYRRTVAGVVAIPVGAMRAVEAFRARGGGLVLAADKGDSRLAAHDGRQLPEPVRHAEVISFDVNLHALARHATLSGGRAHTVERGHRSIEIVALDFADSAALGHAYNDEVRGFGPDDWFGLSRALERNLARLTLSEIVNTLRLHRWDAVALALTAERLRPLLPTATDDDLAALRDGARLAWRSYLPLGDADPHLPALGALLADLGLYRDALPLLEAAARVHPAEPELRRLVSLCRQK